MNTRQESVSEEIGIAVTILKQLGGAQFSAMTGARHFVALKSGLSFQIPTVRKINIVKIILTPLDLYDIEFLNSKRLIEQDGNPVIKSIQGVYFDQLQEIFTDVTGLYTHL